MEAWDKCGDEPHLFTGREWFGGIDLSTTTDLTAWVELSFDGEGYCDVVPHFWLPGWGVEDKERRDRAPYREWARAGLMTLTEGDIVDYSVVRQHLNDRVALIGEPYEVGFDPWSARQFCEVDLPSDGFRMAQVRQGYATLSSPTKQLLELVISGKLRHGGNPILRWMADNAVSVSDPAGNTKLDKSKATSRIDGIAALVNALDRSSRRLSEEPSAPVIVDFNF
jgi:phage terminase large subunit-like protein